MNRLREWRVARGIRSEALAGAAGISAEYLRRLERQEHDCATSIALSLAHLLAVPVEELFTLAPEQQALLKNRASALLPAEVAEPMVAPGSAA